MAQHPITPPWDLVQHWSDEALTSPGAFEVKIKFATYAAQWGADQELEACCEWLGKKVLLQHQSDVVPALRTSRRLKPPSLKEQALTALDAIATGANNAREQYLDIDTIRRALEQLND
jgi:hypothetical protein